VNIRRPEFVIWSPRYSDGSGGVILLHLLCARLNELGYSAAMWPDIKPTSWKSVRSALSWMVKGLPAWNAATPFNNPIANRTALADAVAFYPETISGNPLRAPKVARWLLHRPAFHVGRAEYGSDDLLVFHEHAFNTPGLPDTHRLSLTYVNPVYRDRHEARRGSAYLVRKGQGREMVHPPGAIPLDGLSHEETANVLNRVEHVYSYDPYTMYNHYAAISGAVPIIIPPAGMTSEAWLPDPNERAGIAWGPDDIDRAVATRPALMKRFADRRIVEDEMVHRFVQMARSKDAW